MRMLLVLAMLALSACASTKPMGGELPASIYHTVFIKLNDPADTDALIADTRALGNIPGVVNWAVGRRIDSGRTNVLADFDVGLYVGFASQEAYKAYVDHPVHQSFLTRWRPRFQTVQIRDFGAEPVPLDPANNVIKGPSGRDN